MIAAIVTATMARAEGARALRTFSLRRRGKVCFLDTYVGSLLLVFINLMYW